VLFGFFYSLVIPCEAFKLTTAIFITIIKDIVLATTAVIASLVAIKGLNTWQRQLKGKSEYELSKSILVTLFHYRDTIDGVRHSVMWVTEMPSPPEEELNDMSFDERSFYGTSKAYQNRWDKVQKNDQDSMQTC